MERETGNADLLTEDEISPYQTVEDDYSVIYEHYRSNNCCVNRKWKGNVYITNSFMTLIFLQCLLTFS